MVCSVYGSQVDRGVIMHLTTMYNDRSLETLGSGAVVGVTQSHEVDADSTWECRIDVTARGYGDDF
jgi:hypothetical protein